jgi:RimJ/RimL family protein N-acetyltransferase
MSVSGERKTTAGILPGSLKAFLKHARGRLPRPRRGAMAPAARPSVQSAGSAGPSVRLASEHDVPGLIRLINRLALEAALLFVMPMDPETGAEELSQFLWATGGSGNNAMLLAETAGALVGLATATGGAHPAKRGAVEIGIGVLNEHQGRGIGTALMAALEAWARGAGIHRLQLPVVATNAPAITLYRKCGFITEGVLRESVMLDGRLVDQLMMAKLLG